MTIDFVSTDGKVAQLEAVAEAARELVRSVHPSLGLTHELVDEAALTALETALAAAGYDMTDEEFQRRIDEGDREYDAWKERQWLSD